ncbi:MAG: hypothetical protein GXY86_04950, partial [Firmicutes bacterium]|nr:hypothetical protein [Bacillota bacterium]
MLIRLFWKFRKVIWSALRDYTKIQVNCNEFSRACEIGVDGSSLAKQSLLNLLSLPTCSRFVLTTQTVKDDAALKRLRDLINDKYVFIIAWKILLGNWDVNVKQSRWSEFIDLIKDKIPFVDKTKAVTGLAGNKQNELELTEQNELDVAELVGILYFASVISPKF